MLMTKGYKEANSNFNHVHELLFFIEGRVIEEKK